jgi:hypothetical protein
MYALMASAAGVGILASAQPATARIVYTPAHRVITNGHHYDLDLNHDGVTDFALINSVQCNTDQCFYDLTEKPTLGNSVIGMGRGSFLPYASALHAGAPIGPKRHFVYRPAILGYVYQGGGGTSSRGPWVNVTNRYLGLKFIIKSKPHFGWARLTVTVSGTTVTGTLTGYAYETIPNKPLIAGKTKEPDHAASINSPDASLPVPASKPTTLGMLALGAPALSIWRREESLALTR